VLVVSLEQPRRELTERLTAAASGVDGRLLRSGRFGHDEAKRVAAAADRLRGWRLRVNDFATQTAGQIAAGARRARRDLKGLDLIVVDYLDLVAADNPKANRNEQTGASCRRLREMARELAVPVVCCCQLNRDAAGENELPKLHHLRNSGEIEQHADAVLFLHRSGAWQPGRPDRVELHVAKQRNGPKASLQLDHRSELYTFEEASVSW
jgi:replicative DNA helicase